MASAELTILDVGHGNCAVATDNDGVVIFDAATGNTLVEFLEERGLTEIEAVLISHADADHIGGVLPLLLHSSIYVRRIYLNPDVSKTTAIWQDFRHALADARKRKGTEVQTQLTTTSSKELTRGEVGIEILAPTPEIAASGSGGQDLKGRPLTPNSMSVAVRIMTGDLPQVLFLGDLDEVGLENLLVESPRPKARVLVFPHHGGLPGRTDAFQFARRLCELVEPEMVIFSIGRGKHGTPHPEIVRGVLSASPQAHIACTQLSERCAGSLPPSPSHHLNDRPARGRLKNSCCAGTIVVRLAKSIEYTPEASEHRAFVMTEAPTALCLKENSSEAAPS